MKKYYIGLIILTLLTLGLTGFVVYKGVQSKEDVKTNKKAQEIAEKLNEYVSKEQEIPDSLNDAKVTDVPSTIRYEKLSEEKYKFCATYKSAKGYSYGWDGGGVTNLLYGSALRQGASYDESLYPNSYEPSSLYIDSYYNAGENCQTIKPYIYKLKTTPLGGTGGTSPTISEWCDPESEYYIYYKDSCEAEEAEDAPLDTPLEVEEN